MSNPWAAFEKLLPSKSRWIGKIESIGTGKAMVSLPIGVNSATTPNIAVNSTAAYSIGDYVFIEDSDVVSAAPNIRAAYREVIY